jgi:hypothetical protein
MFSSTFEFSQKQRSKNAPPVEVTERVESILRAVHRYRLLEWRQIIDLFGSSVGDTKELAELVELLYRNAYLEEIPRPLYPHEEAKGQVFRLGVAGAQLLSGQLSIPFPDFQYWGKKNDKRSERTEVSRDYLSHSIELADSRMTFERAAAQNGYDIKEWRDETELKRYGTWPRVDIELADGVQVRVPILPDTNPRSCV